VVVGAVVALLLFARGGRVAAPGQEVVAAAAGEVTLVA
jgi:hypothetical protein